MNVGNYLTIHNKRESLTIVRLFYNCQTILNYLSVLNKTSHIIIRIIRIIPKASPPCLSELPNYSPYIEQYKASKAFGLFRQLSISDKSKISNTSSISHLSSPIISSRLIISASFLVGKK